MPTAHARAGGMARGEVRGGREHALSGCGGGVRVGTIGGDAAGGGSGGGGEGEAGGEGEGEK